MPDRLGLGTGTNKRTVDRFKFNANEILDDNNQSPITCQALIDVANDKAMISDTGDTVSGRPYHFLPPSGRKIHEHVLHPVLRFLF